MATRHVSLASSPLPSPPAGQRLYRIPEVGQMLGLSARSVWTLIASKQLRALRVSARATRVAAEDIDAFIAEARAREDR